MSDKTSFVARWDLSATTSLSDSVFWSQGVVQVLYDYHHKTAIMFMNRSVVLVTEKQCVLLEVRTEFGNII